MKIGILGAGYVGRGIAAMAVRHGHQAMLSNSRGPQTLGSDPFMLGCEVGTIEEAVDFGDIVVLTTTVQHFKSLPNNLLAGKLVVDATNYWKPRITL